MSIYSLKIDTYKMGEKMLSIHKKTGLPDNPCVDTIQRDGLVCPLPQHNICVTGNILSLYIGLGSVYVGVRGLLGLILVIRGTGFCVCGGSGFKQLGGTLGSVEELNETFCQN